MQVEIGVHRELATRKCLMRTGPTIAWIRYETGDAGELLEKRNKGCRLERGKSGAHCLAKVGLVLGRHL